MISFAAAIPLAVASVAGPVELPSAWAGDIGAPVAPGVFLYGDTMQPGNFVQGTTVIVDGEPLTNVLPADDTFYWPGDGFQMPDGRLFVVVSEMRQTGDTAWSFVGVDTDAFIVDDPSSRWEWNTATKIEDGPWGAESVAFQDQYPLAVTFSHTEGSTLWSVTSQTPWESWVPLGGEFPDSHGPFVPVQTDDGWWGVSWAIWGTMSADTTVALWHSDLATGPYEWVRTVDNVGETYAHSLGVIDGVVYHYFSTLNGRVTYQEVDL